MNVKLISITNDVEKIIAYCARVSSPQNQDNENIAGLLKYCINHKHWSPFEMGNMILEIETSRAISAQILRHRSFSFQEFSQRYAEVQNFEYYVARRQDTKNRQNSIDDMDEETKRKFHGMQNEVIYAAVMAYKEALDMGIAKEQARMLLPMSTATKLYMNGTIRSWIHYLQVRNKEEGAQLEHVEVADKAREIFIERLPIISEALGWSNI